MSFGDVSKMVASMWDNLDADNKTLYKKRTEMAKKDYLRQLAAYRATLVSKGQGDDMYGYHGYGYPGMQSHGLGQNIPPHPPGPGLVQQQHLPTNTYMAASPEYLNHQVISHQFLQKLHAMQN